MLESLQKDIEQLIALYEKEKVEAESLRTQLAQAKEANEAYRKQIEELEHQIDNQKLKEAFLSPTGTDSGAKEKVTKLIREIDKCIAMLEK